MDILKPIYELELWKFTRIIHSIIKIWNLEWLAKIRNYIVWATIATFYKIF